MRDEIEKLLEEVNSLWRRHSETKLLIDELQRKIDYLAEQEKIEIPEQSVMNKSVRDIGLSVRTSNALMRGGVLVVGDILKCTHAQLKKISGYGVLSDNEFRQKLKEMDIQIPEV